MKKQNGIQFEKNIREGISGFSDSFNMAVLLDSSRHLISDKHRSVEIKLYSYIDGSGDFHICLGHDNEQNREGSFHSIIHQSIPKIHNFGFDNIDNSFCDNLDNKSNINEHSPNGDCIGITWSFAHPCFSGCGGRGVGFSRMDSRTTESERIHLITNDVDLNNNLRFVPCRNGKVNHNSIHLYSSGSSILHNKREVFT